jgi:hypothetical protein
MRRKINGVRRVVREDVKSISTLVELLASSSTVEREPVVDDFTVVLFLRASVRCAVLQ